MTDAPPRNMAIFGTTNSLTAEQALAAGVRIHDLYFTASRNSLESRCRLIGYALEINYQLRLAVRDGRLHTRDHLDSAYMVRAAAAAHNKATRTLKKYELRHAADTAERAARAVETAAKAAAREAWQDVNTAATNAVPSDPPPYLVARERTAAVLTLVRSRLIYWMDAIHPVLDMIVK